MQKANLQPRLSFKLVRECLVLHHPCGVLPGGLYQTVICCERLEPMANPLLVYQRNYLLLTGRIALSTSREGRGQRATPEHHNECCRVS